MMSVKNKALKYQEVTDVIEKQILDGRYAFGQRIPTQNALTRHFGVSRPTIEKALEHLEDKGLIQRRKGSGTFVRYERKKNVDKNKFAFIALRPPLDYDFESNFVQALGSNFSTQAKQKNFEFMSDIAMTSDIARLLGHGLQSCREMIEAQVKGVFMLPVDFADDDNHLNQKIADTFYDANIPVVLIDRDVYQMPRRSRYDIVGINNRRGALVITDHLIKNGAREVYFINRPLRSNAVTDRVEGFCSALQYNNIEPAGKVIEDYNGLDSGQVSVFDIINKSTSPVGFVCLNDQTASIFMRDVIKAGFDVPGKVRIAGFDDLPTSSLLFSPLTTIRQPVEAIVQTAINVMENRLKDSSMPPREIYVAEELVVRESCGSGIKGGK